MKLCVICILFVHLLAPYNVPTNLIIKQFKEDTFHQVFNAILEVETNKIHFKNGKVVTSHKGAKGISQIMPDTAQFIINKSKAYHLRVSDISNRDINLWMGKWYFRYLCFDIFPGNINQAISGYNAGHNSKKFMTNYVRKVNEAIR